MEYKTFVESLSESKKETLLKKLKAKYSECYEMVKVPENDLKKGIPLSIGQLRILNTSLDYPEIPIHVVSQTLTLKGEINKSILESAIRLVVDAHHAFKLSFVKNSEGQWIQKLGEVSLYSLNEIYINNLDEFDFSVKDSIRKINRIGESENIYFIIGESSFNEIKIAIITHNLFFDAWSYELLNTQILETYNKLKNDLGIDLKADFQFSDFVSWQNRWITTKEARTQLSFWEDTLSGHKQKRLEQYQEVNIERSYEGERIEFDFSMDVKSRIDEYSKLWGVTSFMVIVSILQSYLMHLTKENSVVIGTIHANRTRKNSDTLIGYLLNYISLKFDITDELNLENIVKKNKSNILNAFNNADIPYECIVDHLGFNFNGNRNPLFDILFIYENIPVMVDDVDGYKVSKGEINRFVSRFDITLSVFDYKSSYHCIFEYDKKLFDRIYIADLIDGMKNWFNLLLSNSGKQNIR